MWLPSHYNINVCKMELSPKEMTYFDHGCMDFAFVVSVENTESFLLEQKLLNYMSLILALMT